MEFPDISKITIEKIHSTLVEQKGIELDILRLDKIHPVISGNKWFKLKYHLENFHAGNYKGILTFGGAWSNHIVATAATCFQQQIKCAGIIRGEKPAQPSLTLQQAADFNMELKLVPRKEYGLKNSASFSAMINTEFPGFYIIPEGGAGEDGEKGAGEIISLINKKQYTHIICAIGTATMFRGIAKKMKPHQQLIGFPVLKGFKEINEMPFSKLLSDYHFGGYAKKTGELIAFMNEFYKKTNIPTDFVYTGKMVFGVIDLIKKKSFPPGSKLLMLHSGGLQGNASLPVGTLIF